MGEKIRRAARSQAYSNLEGGSRRKCKKSTHRNFASPPTAAGLVSVAVSGAKLKVVIGEHSKGVALEATKKRFFEQGFDNGFASWAWGLDFDLRRGSQR